MKEIRATVTKETYDKLFSIANKENKKIADVIEEIIVKETKTITKEKAMELYDKTH